VQRALAHRCLELARGSLGDHLAAVDDGDALGELVGLVEVLGAEQHRGALADERPDDVPDLVARARVEPGRGLVEEHQLRRDDDAGGDVEPPAHSAREVLDQTGAGVAEPERLEQLVGACLGLGALEPQQPAEQDEVLAPRQLLVDRGQLAGQADEPTDGVGLLHDVTPEHAGLALVGPQQGGQHADRGRLAGPVGSQDAIHRAARNGQVDAVDGTNAPEGLDEAGGFDGERGMRVHIRHRP
jgi:hypothetical protein